MVDLNTAFICYIFGQFIGCWGKKRNMLFIKTKADCLLKITRSIQEELSPLSLKTTTFSCSCNFSFEERKKKKILFFTGDFIFLGKKWPFHLWCLNIMQTEQGGCCICQTFVLSPSEVHTPNCHLSVDTSHLRHLGGAEQWPDGTKRVEKTKTGRQKSGLIAFLRWQVHNHKKLDKDDAKLITRSCHYHTQRSIRKSLKSFNCSAPQRFMTILFSKSM